MSQKKYEGILFSAEIRVVGSYTDRLLNLEHKCNSIYTATWMHTSLCCVVLNTSAFFRSSMQEFLFWKGRSQLKTPYHSSFPLGQEIRDSNHSCFRETPCLFVIGIGKRAKSIADVPDCTNLSFHLSGMIADHRRNLGRVGKIETLPILQIHTYTYTYT